MHNMQAPIDPKLGVKSVCNTKYSVKNNNSIMFLCKVRANKKIVSVKLYCKNYIVFCESVIQ